MGDERPPPAFLCAVVIAHRGASAHAPEHTFRAYDLALEMGADAIELDVRSTADGALVAIHDAALTRTTGDPREVASLRLADLDELAPAVRPPSLDAVLGRYGDSTRYWIDMKAPDADAEAVMLDLVSRHGLERRVGVQSFDPGCIDRLSAAGGVPPLVQLYRRAVPPQALLGDLDRIAGKAVAIGRAHELIDAELMAAAQARNLEVHAYTVNEREEAERLVALGVAALITDAPDRVGGVFEAERLTRGPAGTTRA